MNALPSQSRFIIGTEACERFSFYGMKSILMLYMTGHLLMSENWATSTLHIFVGMVYLLPVAGVWLADKVWGRYKTILYISLLYCVGHGVLATADLFQTIEARRYILMAGLLIIALGPGGIKPCVSAFMGDQIPDKSPRLMTKAFNAFYWAINLGSFFSFLVIPAMEQHYGYSWAFAVPGIFMGIATFVFWLGRREYNKIPPSRSASRGGFWRVLFTVLFRGGWNKATLLCGENAVTDTRHILKILSIFAFVIPFWSIFDQTASSWVAQGNNMIPISIPLPGSGTWSIGPEEIQAANPVFVMIFIPLITVFVYPNVVRLAKPLVRLGTGIALSSVTFLIVAWLQHRLESGAVMSIAWQLIPYCVLTISEILVSTTGLEFAYTQAPLHLKSVITSFWNLTIFAGNMLVAAITFFLSNGQASNAISTDRFLLYSALAGIVAVAYFFRRAGTGQQTRHKLSGFPRDRRQDFADPLSAKPGLALAAAGFPLPAAPVNRALRIPATNGLLYCSGCMPCSPTPAFIRKPPGTMEPVPRHRETALSHSSARFF